MRRCRSLRDNDSQTDQLHTPDKRIGFTSSFFLPLETVEAGQGHNLVRSGGGGPGLGSSLLSKDTNKTRTLQQAIKIDSNI